MRSLSLAILFGVTAATCALAQNEPIRSPQDAACRDEAKGKVFGAPNPQRLSLYNLGTQLYHECMRRSGAEGSDARPRRRRSS